MAKYRVCIEQDTDTESPLEWDQWELHSFSRRHANFKHPDEFVGIGFRRKLECGTAFTLGYFEHGQCQWALSGEQHYCPWDSVNCAGVLLWTGKPDDLGDTPEKRRENARRLLAVYTDWCNGNCYWFSIDRVGECSSCHREELENVDSCGGYIGTDDIIAAVKEHMPKLEEGDEVEVVGECGCLIDADDLT